MGSHPLTEEQHIVEHGSRPSVRAHSDLHGVYLVGNAAALELVNSASHPLEQLWPASVAEGHEAPVGRHRELAGRTDAPVHDEVATFADLAEPEGLELTDDLEGERVVELADVDVGGLQTRRLERPPSGPAPEQAVRVPRDPTTDEVVGRWVLVVGPDPVHPRTED